ncbi:MAG: trigger factor [Bacteroidota bacterium]
MPTEIRQLNEVDYALDITVPADEIQAQITDALKKERGQISLKGFRPGKVPMGVVRKLVGKQVAVQIAEAAIGEAYRTAVVEPEAIEPIGHPRLVDMDFEIEDPQAELTAEVRFGVRPEFELAAMEGVPVTKYVRTFTEEDIEADLQRRLDLDGSLEDEPEGTVLTEDHVAIVDIQPITDDGEPDGPVQHGAQIVLANPDLREELKSALLGQTAGGEVRVEFPQDDGADGEVVDRYRVAVQQVQRRDVPEMTDEWVKGHTSGKVETVEALREEARADLERSWERRSRQAMESRMVEVFVEAHPFRVPENLVEAGLDAMLDDLRERQPDKALPPGFDVPRFREENREQAEAQVRWLLVKDRLVEDEDLEVTNEDFEAEFARIAGEGGDVEMMRDFFTQNGQMLQQMGDHLLNQRVFESLSRRFEIVEKTREEVEREAEARRLQREAEEKAAEAVAAEQADDKPGLLGRVFGKKDDASGDEG